MIVNNYDTSLVLGMCILNEVCYLTTSIGAIYFFYNGVIISWEHLKRSICQGHSVYFTGLVATIHIVCTWFEKNEIIFLLRKAIVALHRTSCICLKSAVLDARKYLQPPHCLLVNALICNFTTVIAALH